MKIILTFFVFFSLSQTTVLAQGLGVRGHLNITLSKAINEKFRVKSYQITSGKIDIDRKLFSYPGNMQSYQTEMGIGLDNNFSNFGGYGLISLFQVSPFTGMEGNFLFEEFFDGSWRNAAYLAVSFPVVGSPSINLNYYEGYGNSEEDVNTPFFDKTLSGRKRIANGYGYTLIDVLASKGYREEGNLYDMYVEIQTRAWLQKKVTLPTSGSTTISGIIKINTKNIKLANNVQIEDAIKNTLKLNVNSYKNAQWIKQDNDNSYISFSDPTYVGKLEFYDFNMLNGIIKYKFTTLPNIVYNYKYFENKDEVVAIEPPLNVSSFNSGKKLLFDKNKEYSIKTLYTWLSYEIKENANQYWEPNDQNAAPQIEAGFFNKNNIMNEIPQFQVIATCDSPLAISSKQANTMYDANGNIFIEAPTFSIDGLWTLNNAKDCFIVDPNFNSIKASFNPIVNPANAILLNENVKLVIQKENNLNILNTSVIKIDNKLNQKQKVLNKNKILTGTIKQKF